MLYFYSLVMVIICFYQTLLLLAYRQNKKRGELSLLALSCVRVGRQGFEPWALGLKVPCSAN